MKLYRRNLINNMALYKIAILKKTCCGSVIFIIKPNRVVCKGEIIFLRFPRVCDTFYIVLSYRFIPPTKIRINGGLKFVVPFS